MYVCHIITLRVLKEVNELFALSAYMSKMLENVLEFLAETVNFQKFRYIFDVFGLGKFLSSTLTRSFDWEHFNLLLTKQLLS